jgi:hypothetical protein
MEMVARAMAIVTKRARARVARAMAMVAKRVIATDGEGNVENGKSNGDSNE